MTLKQAANKFLEYWNTTEYAEKYKVAVLSVREQPNIRFILEVDIKRIDGKPFTNEEWPLTQKSWLIERYMNDAIMPDEIFQ